MFVRCRIHRTCTWFLCLLCCSWLDALCILPQYENKRQAISTTGYLCVHIIDRIIKIIGHQLINLSESQCRVECTDSTDTHSATYSNVHHSHTRIHGRPRHRLATSKLNEQQHCLWLCLLRTICVTNMPSSAADRGRTCCPRRDSSRCTPHYDRNNE